MSENSKNINSSSSNISSNPNELNSQSQIELNGFSITSEREEELENNMVFNNESISLNSSSFLQLDDNIDNTYKISDDLVSGKKKYIIYFFIACEENESRDITDKIDVTFLGPAENLIVKVKGFIYEHFRIFGDLFELKCRGCEHLTESHVQLSRGIYKCKDCEEEDNICRLKTDELEDILTRIKSFYLNSIDNQSV